MKSKIYNILLRFKHIFPDKIQDFLVDLFFKYLPVYIIMGLVDEFAGYFKHYLPKTGETVVDAGSWKGHFTVVASRLVGKEGIVIAIEPQMDMYDKLKNRLKLLRIRNVILLNRGLYDEDTNKEFAKEETQSFSVISNNTNCKGKTEVVTLSKLDTILSECGVNSVNFIKMDIEGVEVKALLGANHTLSSSDVNLAIASYHIVNGERTCFKVEQILQCLGYATLTEHPSHLTTYAWRNMSSKMHK